MKRDIFARLQAVERAILIAESVHADSTTLDPYKEANHMDEMQELYQLRAELKECLLPDTNRTLQRRQRAATHEEALKLSHLYFLESNEVATDGED